MSRMLLLLLLAIPFFSCEDEEEYPFTQSPYIELESITYQENLATESARVGDIISFSFILWDKEGDIGRELNDFGFPYHHYDLIFDHNDDLVRLENQGIPPYYSVPTSVLGYDFSEDEQILFFDFSNKSFYSNEINQNMEFSCDENIILYEMLATPYDTLFGRENRYHRNLHVSLINETGSDFECEDLGVCVPNSCRTVHFDAVLPIISNIRLFVPKEDRTTRIERISDFSWRITYNIQSIIFPLVFENNRLEFKISVSDSQINESNIITTGFIDLDEILID